MRKRLCYVLIIAALVLCPACSKGNGGEADVKYSGNAAADIGEAIKAGDIETVRQLIGKDAKLLDLRDRQGRTLLHYAVLYDQPEIVNMLIDKGMDPNVKDKAQLTPLGALDESGFRAMDARKALLKRGGGA